MLEFSFSFTNIFVVKENTMNQSTHYSTDKQAQSSTFFRVSCHLTHLQQLEFIFDLKSSSVTFGRLIQNNIVGVHALSHSITHLRMSLA